MQNILSFPETRESVSSKIFILGEINSYVIDDSHLQGSFRKIRAHLYERYYTSVMHSRERISITWFSHYLVP